MPPELTFSQTLEKHLKAIQKRDLSALVETLPPDRLTLIMADGRLVDSTQEFIELHRDWFRSQTWTIAIEPVNVTESADLAVATLHLDYRDRSPDGQATRQTSYLTLVFARRDGQWVMIQDQNTPIKT
jgi:uncharacterized protein (TIGR02246 family)